MTNIKWLVHRNMLNKIMYYASDIKVLIRKAPDFIKDDSLNNYVPQYIIIKDDNKNYYWCLKLKTYGLDYLKEQGYIIDKQDIINNYISIWSGSNLQDSKEIIQDDYNNNGDIQISL